MWWWWVDVPGIGAGPIGVFLPDPGWLPPGAPRSDMAVVSLLVLGLGGLDSSVSLSELLLSLFRVDGALGVGSVSLLRLVIVW